MNVRTMIVAGACALVVGGLGLGFLTIGSPSQNRMRAQDARVQQAISEIASQTTAYADSDGRRRRPVYPANLDADVRHAITFRARSNQEYVLCANFNIAGNDFAAFGDESPNWKHPAGPHCYRFHWKPLASDNYQTVPLPN